MAHFYEPKKKKPGKQRWGRLLPQKPPLRSAPGQQNKRSEKEERRIGFVSQRFRLLRRLRF